MTRAVAEVIGDLIASGLSPDQIVLIAELATAAALEHSDAKAASSAAKRSERNRRYYALNRLKTSENRLTSETSENVLKPSESVLKSRPLARVVNNLNSEEISGKKRKNLLCDSAFDRFWLAYPRKIGKGAARKSYEKALRRIDEPDAGEQISKALEAAKRAWAKRNDPEFIPHPATWLNQDRWEDEPESGNGVVTFTAPPLTPQQQADLEQLNAERRNRPAAAQAGLRPLDALAAVAGSG